MSRETSNLGLILYDPSEDKDVKVRDVINKVLGFTDSNTIKIDTKTKDIDTNIKTLHDYIIGEDGNVVFYNKKEVFLAVHPVGSIFLSTSDVEPAGLYGGTWEKIAEERTLMGASATHPVGTTVEAGLPNIKGTFIAALRDGFTINSNARITGAFYENGTTTGEDGYNSISTNVGIPSGGAPFGFDASRSNSIYGHSTTVQPATYYINIWKRIE
nr:MAG TPA: baseplate protein [Caudoviricetes sp.]